MLLSPLQLKKLDALSLQARKAFTGASKGEKRSTKRGSSVEFADFRSYNAGDDIRRIDWNAYARFDKLYLKMFLEEEDLDLTLLIDASASMQFGEPTKLRAASEIAGALGYVGLANFDRVSAAFFGEKLRSQMPPARGKGAVAQLFRFLETQDAVGKADFSAVCKRAAMQAKRSGIAVVISDFLFAEGYESGLKTLAARGFETTVIQLLSREELEPSLMGDFKLVDVEDKSIREISVSSSLLRAYKKNLDDYTSNLRKFCLRYGMNYVLAPGDASAEEIVGRMLRSAGVVK
ncbi:Protein of unknown function DUF58 [Abditibacterium utsteinense]|uniref:DUF58 domain-containing protein n=1 Tax=Abditibacterium utsteinense TaxID=1960156 RepID=A0A2S8SQN9_9BACT|nr:DUF58 domain-containing protein [Abditibacterium utsteinense]PQV63124.1 Protein of unknown function DUF58 [Abditibacterium utsteinense]